MGKKSSYVCIYEEKNVSYWFQKTFPRISVGKVFKNIVNDENGYCIAVR